LTQLTWGTAQTPGKVFTHLYTLTYRYSYGETTYEYTQNVGRSLSKAAYPGKRITVRCLPEDPAIVRIADDLLP